MGGRALALGRYRLEQRLGAGAFGVVWRAHDEQLDRMVAVKRIELHDARIAARADREVLASARLNHPGIVALYEARRDGEALYLVSELVRGRTLGELVERRALSDRDTLRIGIALCSALDHAHAHRVIHRDLKPANILIPRVPDGESGMAKLTDFGVAHLVGDDGLTRTGDVVGTIAYMSPEQAECREVTAASDLYSLALVLYEALAKVNPVRAAGAAATARRVGTELPSLELLRPDLPPDLIDAIDAAVLPEPQERGSVRELRETLEAVLADVGRDVGYEPTRQRAGHAPARRAPAHGIERPVAAPDLARPSWPGQRRRARLESEPVAEGLHRPRIGLTRRILAAAAAGTATACALALLGPAAPASHSAALLPGGAAAALAVLLFPRAGVVLATAALSLWLGASGAPGIAVLVVAAIGVTAAALPRDGDTWILPLLAPVLAILGAALAWPALAGQASSGPRRALLGALGVWWIALAEPLARSPLLLGDLPGAPGRKVWEGSTVTTLDEIVGSIVGHGVPLLAVVWACAAWALPLLVRGRVLAADLVLVCGWCAALAAGTLSAAHSLTWDPQIVGVGLGLAVAALLALVAAAARPLPESDPRTRGLRRNV